MAARTHEVDVPMQGGEGIRGLAGALRAAFIGVSSDPDVELVRRAQHGDDDAFRQLVRQYQHRVYRTAVALARDEDLAEDLTQEVFLKLFRCLGQFREKSRFSTWFYRLSLTTLLSGLRLRMNRPLGFSSPEEKVDVSCDSDPRRRALDTEHQELLTQAMLGLPVMHQEILTLVFLQECSYEDAAEILGIPMGTMKNRLFRARKLLARELVRLGVLPEDQG